MAERGYGDFVRLIQQISFEPPFGTKLFCQVYETRILKQGSQEWGSILYLRWENSTWRGSKMLLSRGMSDSEIVQAAFDQLRIDLERDTRRSFLLGGAPVMALPLDIWAARELVKNSNAEQADARAG